MMNATGGLIPTVKVESVYTHTHKKEKIAKRQVLGGDNGLDGCNYPMVRAIVGDLRGPDEDCCNKPVSSLNGRLENVVGLCTTVLDSRVHVHTWSSHVILGLHPRGCSLPNKVYGF